MPPVWRRAAGEQRGRGDSARLGGEVGRIAPGCEAISRSRIDIPF